MWVNENKNEVGNETISAVLKNLEKISSGKTVVKSFETVQANGEDALLSLEMGTIYCKEETTTSFHLWL